MNTIVFDKTGALTYEKPTVIDVASFGISERDLLSVAAAVESKLEHPLEQVITFFARKRGVIDANVFQFKSIAGKGVVATVEGNNVIIGNKRFLREHDIVIRMLRIRFVVSIISLKQ